MSQIYQSPPIEKYLETWLHIFLIATHVKLVNVCCFFLVALLTCSCTHKPVQLLFPSFPPTFVTESGVTFFKFFFQTIPDKDVGTQNKISPLPTHNVDNQVNFSLFVEKSYILQHWLGEWGIDNPALLSQLLFFRIVEAPRCHKWLPLTEKLTTCISHISLHCKCWAPRISWLGKFRLLIIFRSNSFVQLRLRECNSYLYHNYCLRTSYREQKIYLNSTPSPSSPHHLRRTWTSLRYLGMVQWIVGTDTLRKHLRCPSTAGGRLVTTGILSWSETVLEGVLEARKKCSHKWFIADAPMTAGCQAKSYLHRSLS